MITNGYSLWLIPNEQSKLYHRLVMCIKSLATVRNTAVFEPHITLLGGLREAKEKELCRCASVFSRCIKHPVRISFGNVGRTYVDYFRAVFLEVRGSQGIRRTHELAREKMKSDRGGYYRLHLSLAYGNLAPETIDGLKARVELMSPKLVGASTFATAIELWHTQGEVHEWHKVARFPISKD